MLHCVRLDMDTMELSQPETTDNQCQGDQFIISGGSPVPAICGTNSGIHSEYSWYNFDDYCVAMLQCT